MSFFNYSGDEQDPLESIIMLEDFLKEDWEKVMTHTQFMHFDKGEELLAMGDEDTSLYILIEGQVEAFRPSSRGREKRLALINAGSVFGEVAFFDGHPRAASVRSMTDGNMLKLTREGFERLAAWEPLIARRLLQDLGKVLALRLRNAG